MDHPKVFNSIIPVPMSTKDAAGDKKIPTPKLENLDWITLKCSKGLAKIFQKAKKEDITKTLERLRHYPVRPVNGGRDPKTGLLELEEETIDLLTSGPCGKEMFGGDIPCGARAVKRLKERNLGLIHLTLWDGDFYDSMNSLDMYILLCYWSQKYQFRSYLLETPHLRHNVSEYLVMTTHE